MKNLLIYIAIFLSSFAAPIFVSAAGNDAQQILDKLRRNMEAPAVEVSFTINAGSGAVDGSALISGPRLAMTTPRLCVWYDGTTQWVYQKETRELNISTPDVSDVLASNPFAILNSENKEYKVTSTGSSAGTMNLRLTPTDPTSGIERFDVSVDSATGWPRDIEIRFSNDAVVKVTVKKISAIEKQPDSVFKYSKVRYPADEVVDLR